MVLAIGLATLMLLILIVIGGPWFAHYGRISWRWPVGLTLVALALILLGYQHLGSYTLVQQEALRQQEATRLNTMLDKQSDDPKLYRLQQRIRQSPDNGAGWFSLAQHYLYRNEFDDALIALQQAERLQGVNAALDAAHATILYYQAGKMMTDEAVYWLQQSLAKEPLQYTALMLQASDQFTRGRYTEAIAIWQRLLESENSEVDRAVIIQALTLARMMQRAS
ncbi:cytochrome C heme lyase [Yersinia mollaretii]|uniref:TPR domain-containing protein n=1 Tax=Yersinia mollaretii TaxID=33060 RepID=UPI0005E064E7|nr:cytochrome C heme lyase [Yersinia mollaretii]MDA5525654.1 cytochrome C heme lyase [Yersinia mollaretii]MDA5533853.1 cytochrome C heme lyase [Yersinia mollaretii]MDR7871755.1 cytochrome C heme lyase [Yersinia mollaretii]NIL01783.1 cytochrome C heme lyase [Yersinia mollaretii]PHZ32109.1 cytochrome C heme lyase [Yersinia mollaretii]